jgi:serine/threonine protein kinase
VAGEGVPAHFGRYRIDGLVSRGGMGVVYRATDTGLERTVALKVIAPEVAADPGFRERFVHESRLAAALDHPNVIPVYEAGEHDGTLFLAMRFVDGMDLREAIALAGALEPGRAVRIVAQVAGALDAAHGRGLVHRDVKPANVLLSGPAGEEHPYLTDFGIAKRLDATSGLTQSGQLVGTLDYAAPEQISGAPVDARTDVYALGCLLYAALTGGPPFPRDAAPAVMLAHLHAPSPAASSSRPGVPPALDAVVHRALAKQPADRFPSAGDLGRAATAALRDEAPPGEHTVARGEAAPGAGALTEPLGGPPASGPEEPATAPQPPATSPPPPNAATPPPPNAATPPPPNAATPAPPIAAGRPPSSPPPSSPPAWSRCSS